MPLRWRQLPDPADPYPGSRGPDLPFPLPALQHLHLQLHGLGVQAGAQGTGMMPPSVLLSRAQNPAHLSPRQAALGFGWPLTLAASAASEQP